MKIKGSKEISVKALLIAWIVGIVILVPMRMYQMLKLIDGEQGFYISTDFTVWLMYALLIVLALVFIFGSLISKNTQAGDFSPNGNRVLGVVSILVAASMLFDTVIQFGNFATLFNAYTGYNTTLASYLLKSGALSRLAEAVCAVGAAIYFFFTGLGCFNKKINISKYKVLALTPVLWASFRMLTRLIRTISYVKISDLFYEIIMLLFMMLFFMAFAQLNSKINEKGIEWKVFGYGFMASLMALMVSVPRVFMMLFGKADQLAQDSPVEIWDVFLGIFIIVYLVELISTAKQEKIEE